MGLEKFKKGYKVRKEEYNVVFCMLMTKEEHKYVNRLNCALEKIQGKLLKKAKDGTHISKAFVYRNGKINIRFFDEVSIEKIYYADYVKRGETLPHIVLRSLLELSEKSNCYEKSKNILYLVMDSALDKVDSNMIIDIMKSFENMPYIPILIKEQDVPTMSLERYIEKSGKIYFMDDFQKL